MLPRLVEHPAAVRQRVEYVVRAFDQSGALANQQVGAAGARIEGRAWNGHHLAPLLQRKTRRDQRTRAGRALDHHRTACEPRNDAVAAREVAPRRHGAERRLRDHCALLQKPLEEGAVLLGIDHIDAAAHDRDRAGRERAGMGTGVDAAGHAGDHDEPGRAERRRELLGEVEPARGCVARAHHGDRVGRQQLGAPAQREHRRRIGNGRKRRRVSRLVQRDQASAK